MPRGVRQNPAAKAPNGSLPQRNVGIFGADVAILAAGNKPELQGIGAIVPIGKRNRKACAALTADPGGHLAKLEADFNDFGPILPS